MRELIQEMRSLIGEAEEPMNYAAILAAMLALRTGDTVEITYQDSKTSTKTAKRAVSMSWPEYRDQSSRSDDPNLAFHFKFKAKPSVLLGASKANKAHLNKPGKGGGMLSDYGDEVMFQATLSTKVKPVVSIRKL